MNNSLATAAPAPMQAPRRVSILQKIAARYNVDPAKMLDTLKATAFKGNVTDEQMVALLVVADQYQLNPFTKEIYAFPDTRNGIVPVVGVDGWSRIINSDQNFDGMEFVDGPLDGSGLPEWIECVMYRKDRSHPIKVREYFAEVARPGVGPWKSHPRRMLRHKAMIQCARLAFGFVGIFDEDEAGRIVEATTPQGDRSGRPDTSQVPNDVIGKWVGQVVDTMNQDKDEYEIADGIRAIADELNKFPEVYTAVLDKLAADKIISKAKFRETLNHFRPEGQE
ncbi:MAG: phage recombination protein Bet [Pseudomonadota bacterium]|jgi:phage recombination protein Bet